MRPEGEQGGQRERRTLRKNLVGEVFSMGGRWWYSEGQGNRTKRKEVSDIVLDFTKFIHKRTEINRDGYFTFEILWVP